MFDRYKKLPKPKSEKTVSVSIPMAVAKTITKSDQAGRYVSADGEIITM